MKYQIMLGILFTLLSERKVRAVDLANKYGCSVRSVFRYLDEMTVAGVPIDVSRGPQGGVYISDAYKLPKGLMTREEYARTVDALLAMNEQFSDPTLQSAIDKLTALKKSERADGAISGNILVDSGTWGDERKFSEKLALVERAIKEKETLEIDYYDRGGEHTHRKINPHLLVYKQNVWYAYCYCLLRKQFRLFKVGRMRTLLHTGEQFTPVPFSREEIPLSFWKTEKTVDARFAIAPELLPLAEEWLGVENIRFEDGYVAEVTLPDDETLTGKILSLGTGFCVLAPAELKQRVEAEARAIAKLYAPKKED